MGNVFACPLRKSDNNSLDFVVSRFLMKLFRTNNINVINYCRTQFNFALPSVLKRLNNVVGNLWSTIACGIMYFVRSHFVYLRGLIVLCILY